MKETKKRQSRYKRDPERFPRIYITDRDLEILRGILQCRFLTTSQIKALFFGSDSACKLRLQKLWNKRFLKRIFKPVSFGSSEAIYCPTRKGVNLLVQSGKLKKEEINFRSRQNRVRMEKVQHELDINEIKISLTLAAAEKGKLYLSPDSPNAKKRPNLLAINRIFSWRRGPDTWDYVKDPTEVGEYISVRPDLVFFLNNTAYFLEVDRGTMTLSRFKRKLRGYREYFSNGNFHSKYGMEDFRVLTTTPSERRRNNLVESAIDEQGQRRCLFGVFDEVIKNPFGKVWVRGREYVDEGILEVDRKKKRDEFVRSSVRKLSFLDKV